MDTGLTLSTDMMLVLGLLGFTVAMLILEWIRADIVALLVLVVLGITNLVPVDQLFDGFAGNAVISIIAVMIMGAGLDRTGVLGSTAGYILRVAGGVENRLSLVLCAITGALSAFMQNQALAPLMVPVVSRLASRTGLPLSRLLLPMASCIMLGGTITMVGSSPLILLNDLIRSANRNLPPDAETLEPFAMFSVAPIGLSLLIAGLFYFRLFGRRVLPAGEEKQTVTPGRTESYFADVYGIAGEVIELVTSTESPLVGLSVGEAETLPGAPLILAIKTGDESRLAPPADQMIWVGTVLGVLGRREAVAAWAEANALSLLPRMRNFSDMFNSDRAGICEAVLPPTSRFMRQSVGDLRLRKRFGISVLAVNRGDEIFREDVRKVILKPGDTLVLHSFWRDLALAAEDRDFVIVTDYPKEEARPHKLWNAVGFFALASLLALATDLSLPVALLTGAVGMLLTGVLSMEEAYNAIGWKTVFVTACLIPLGWAMDITGTAAWVAQEVLIYLGGWPDWTLQAAVALLTLVFSQVMSNVGATVMMVPMAINLALAANGNPTVYALIVALSASNTFLISGSNPVFNIITGPGGYRSVDIFRSGLPLTLIVLVVMLVMVNLVF